jgi:hypothetical protein
LISFKLLLLLLLLLLFSTDANELERIQQRFASPCCNRFFLQVHYSYPLALEQIKIAHFAYEEASPQCTVCYSCLSWSKFCPSLLEIDRLRVPAPYISDFVWFNVCSSR